MNPIITILVFLFKFLADDNAPAKQPVTSEDECKALPAVEDITVTTASSSIPV